MYKRDMSACSLTSFSMMTNDCVRIAVARAVAAWSEADSRAFKDTAATLLEPTARVVTAMAARMNDQSMHAGKR